MDPWTLLVVDDSAADRAYIQRLLQRDPHSTYRIAEADSGVAALTQCAQQPPDCVLLDYHLPDMDGLQFLTHLHGQLSEYAPAIIMLTGTGTEMVAVEAMKRGVQDYLVKEHLSWETLSRSIRYAIEQVSTQRQLAAQQRALEQARETLEQRVQERTAELVQVNAALQTEIDIRQRTEAALRESEALYRSLFENAREGIFRSTQAGRFLEVNPALVRMLGYDSADEVLALHLPEDLYVDPTDRARLRTQFEPQGTLNGIELQWKKKDGVQIVISIHAQTIVDAQGAVVGYEGMVLDVTERKHGEQALEALSRRVLEVQETERRTLARELHDEMGQALLALRLDLRAAQRAPQLQPARLEDSLHIVDQLVQQVRQLSLDLRPSLLDDVGLVAALRWYIDRQAQRSGLAIQFTTEGLESRLNPLLETTCFRVAQGAVTNVLRHAHAQHVWVELRRDDKELHLCIRDDGIGFDVHAVRERASQGESLGILGMEERVRLVGGHFSLASELAHGTEVCAHFPLRPSAPEDGK